jgi:hypothetical protein
VKKLILVSALALIAGTFSAAVPSQAAGDCPNSGIVCPAVYDPVICNDGKVYSNSCYARAACARGCQDYPGGPIPVE